MTDKKVLNELYEVIKDRKQKPMENSYTNYLFDKGIDKILKKVGEEAAEVIIAAKNTNNEELIGEICDVVYHMTVLLVEKNIKLEEIYAELEKRSNKIGNKKSERPPIEKI